MSIECHDCDATMDVPDPGVEYIAPAVMLKEAGWAFDQGDPVACIPPHWLCPECQ